MPRLARLRGHVARRALAGADKWAVLCDLDTVSKHQVELDIKQHFLAMLKDKLKGKLPDADCEEGAGVLTGRGEGLFIFARFARADLDDLISSSSNRELTVGDIRDETRFCSSTDRDKMYAKQFERFKTRALGTMAGEDNIDEVYRTVLGAVSVAREPIPIELIEGAIVPEGGRSDSRRTKLEKSARRGPVPPRLRRRRRALRARLHARVGPWTRQET
jgi:hypothetical protein